MKKSMTEKEVSRYLSLADRKACILVSGGVNWKPEYEKELYAIDKEIAGLRKLIDKEHKKRMNRGRITHVR